MKIPNREIQERVFGYYTEELPPEGSFKAKVYELLNQGLEDELFEILTQTWSRKMDDLPESEIRYLLPLTEDELKKLKNLLDDIHDCGSSFGAYSSKELQVIKNRIMNLEELDIPPLNQN
ncbi:MAG: hypothetical protein M3367_03165 [Acidobacteriota bacterium]|nr:hypothetical protein [Acidobacteriota bacterium]